MELIFSLFVIYVIYRIINGIYLDRRKTKVPELTVRFEFSDEDGYRDHERPRGKPATWYENGNSVRVKDYEITNGLVYAGEVLLDIDGYDNDACLINPKLKVSSAEPWEAGDEMGYWPGYDRIPAKCRGAYLKWLAGGRVEPEAYIGYVFLFFYGLERRLLIDGQKGEVSDKERFEIITEVRRLLKVYGDNRSFRGYASNFLAMEWVLYQSDKSVPDYIDFSDRYCSEPFQVVLAQHVVGGKPLPVDVALQWIILHPEFGLRTPARRCAKEFRELFVRRYTDKFGEGLVVKPNKTPLKLGYYAASPSMRGDLKLKLPSLPNPFILTGPVKKLSALAEECTVELEAYSRYLGRKDNDPNSMAALALLPKELMSRAPGVEKVRNLLADVCVSGPGLVMIDALYDSLGEVSPSPLGKKECETLATLIEGLGFGMTPDVRYHNIKPNPDGKVAIFQQGHGVDFRPSKEFRTVGTILRLGAMVSQIDDDLSPSEEATLQSLVKDNRELTAIEKDSLLSFSYWCLRTPQSTAGLKQRLSEVSTAEKTAISHILISVAHADGRIDPQEIKQLEKFYTTLGLDKKQVSSDIHALVASSEPVTVGLRDSQDSFTIPRPTPEPGMGSGFRLNDELIRIREEETRQVKGVLEGIFSDQVEEEVDVGSVPTLVQNPLNALDEAHQNLFHRLLTQDTWERSAIHEVCKELGLMVDGAMEVLNEWAFDNANAPLIDDGEPVYVDLNLAKEIINA